MCGCSCVRDGEGFLNQSQGNDGRRVGGRVGCKEIECFSIWTREENSRAETSGVEIGLDRGMNMTR